MRIFLCLSLVLLSWRVCGQPLVLTDPAMPYTFEGKWAVAEDVQGQWTIAQASQMPFQPIAEESVNYSFKSSVYWFKFSVENRVPDQRWLLELTSPLHDSVSLYVQDTAGRWSHTASGDLLPFVRRPYKHRNFIFSLPLPEGQGYTYYLRIRSANSMQVSMRLYGVEQFYARDHDQQMLNGFFYGGVLLMLLYNLLIFMHIRSISYLYYAGFILFTVAFYAALEGYMSEYVLPFSPNLSNHILVPIGIGAVILLTLFAREFLELPRYHHWLHRGFTGLALVAAALLLMMVFSPLSLMFRSLGVLVLLALTGIFGTSIYSWLRGFRPARFFVLAWCAYTLGTVIYSFQIFALIPQNAFTFNASKFGFMALTALFSLALADRYRESQRQTRQAQEKVLAMQQEANAILEQKVEERTSQLQQKQQEIIAQNEELYQQQEEILAQRDAIEVKNRELSEHNWRIQSSIRAAQLIQQAILPDRQKNYRLMRDHFVLFKPKDVVSGDFYWMHEEGDRGFVAAVDCTGHGVPGAFMTMIAHMLLEKIVIQHRIHRPSRVLTELDEEVRKVLRQHETNSDHGMDLAFCTLERLDAFYTRVIFCGAKRPMWYYDVREKDFFELRGERRGIGGLHIAVQQERPFVDQEVTLRQDSMIYVFSDGYADQHNSRRRSFGTNGLMALLAENAAQDTQFQKIMLEDSLTAHQGQEDQRDDILIIGIRV